MWRAFQTAEAVSVGEVTSCPSPSEARCWLISDITCEARLPLAAGQDEPGVQSPVLVAAATGPGAVAAYGGEEAGRDEGPERTRPRRADEGRLHECWEDLSPGGRLTADNRPGRGSRRQPRLRPAPDEIRVTLCELGAARPGDRDRVGARLCPTPVVVSVRVEVDAVGFGRERERHAPRRRARRERHLAGEAAARRDRDGEGRRAGGRDGRRGRA